MEIKVIITRPDGTNSVYLLPGEADPVPAIDREIQAKIAQFGRLLSVARAINRTMADPNTSADVACANLQSLARVLVDLEGIADSTGFTK